MATDFDDRSQERESTEPVSGLGLVVSMDEHAHTVMASGELDFSNAHQLQDAVSAIELDGHREVVLDLTDLTFCDVRGASTLVSASRLIASNGGRVTVRGASGLPRRILALTGVDTVVELE